MSFRTSRDHLADMLEGIRLIEIFIAGLNLPAYREDIKTKSAVERQLQIITEAAYRLGEEASTVCPGPDWKGLRAMGNILRHGYHKVDDQVVWDTLKDDLPELKRSASATLEHFPYCWVYREGRAVAFSLGKTPIALKPPLYTHRGNALAAIKSDAS